MADDKDLELNSKEKAVRVSENGSALNPCRILLHEAHFMSLRNPSNIYGLLHLCMDGSNKLVVATLRGEVYCLEFHDPLMQRPPLFKSITFSYIPGFTPSLCYTPPYMYPLLFTHAHTCSGC